MKKCASCSKDLPEAALHCVFCGAKQAAAPAVQSSVAKTAFGYSANEVMAQLGNQQPQAPRPQPPPQQQAYQPPPQQPYQPPPQQPSYQASRPQSASQPPPMGGYAQGSGLAPTANAQAKTMFVENGPGQGMTSPMPGNPAAAPYSLPAPASPPAYGGYGQGSGPMSGGPAPIGGMGIHSPPQPTPAPLPTVQPPYLASQTAARAGRPIEPWRDSLRLMMFIWGAVALAAFAAPLMTEPSMVFQWDAIIHGAGKEKIPGLVWAAAALLSIVVGAIPMTSFPRGLLALVLGLAGIFVPIGIAGGLGEWKILLGFIALICLVPGLFARHEYTESSVPRVLVTIGVVLTLVPYLIPDHGQIPLVLLIKALINAGSGMERVIIPLAQIVLAVLCLLVWMPGPATAGAKIFAWIWILFPIAIVVLGLLGERGSPVDYLTKTPGLVLSAFVPGILYSVLVGYGGATVVGKQLE